MATSLHRVVKDCAGVVPRTLYRTAPASNRRKMLLGLMKRRLLLCIFFVKAGFIRLVICEPSSVHPVITFISPENGRMMRR